MKYDNRVAIPYLLGGHVEAMNKKISLLLIGGFLGAGKTTLISQLAQMLTSRGKKVGLVTNDQAYGLVDTEQLRSAGFDVGEVPGACFCCKFNDLVETAEKLSSEKEPDIIIAEPVGSCTDLMATVIEPLRQIYGERFQVGPLTVLLKPEHGSKILSGEGKLGFSPKAAYIFEKQIEEANIVAINKIDKLSEEQLQTLKDRVVERFPDKKVMAISGRNGLNVEELLADLENPELAYRTSMEVDYDIYAAGEAELGWFNCQVAATAADGQEFELDDLVYQAVATISTYLARHELEPAHLKIMGQTVSESAIANHVASDADTELSLASEIRTQSADLIVNARVAASPQELEKLVAEALGKLEADLGVRLELTGVQCFQPGRPVPVHRMLD